MAKCPLKKWFDTRIIMEHCSPRKFRECKHAGQACMRKAGFMLFTQLWIVILAWHWKNICKTVEKKQSVLANWFKYACASVCLYLFVHACKNPNSNMCKPAWAFHCSHGWSRQRALQLKAEKIISLPLFMHTCSRWHSRKISIMGMVSEPRACTS